MKNRDICILALIGILVVAPAAVRAGWTTGSTGTVLSIYLYTPPTGVPDGPILFKLNPMPSTACQHNDYFAIDPSITPVETRNRMYATLMTAKVTGTVVHVGHDSAADCMNGRPRIYALEAG